MAVSIDEIDKKQIGEIAKQRTIVTEGQTLYNKLMQGISKESLDAVEETLKQIKEQGVIHIINAFKDHDDDPKLKPYDDATLSPLGAAIARVIGEPIASKERDIKEKKDILDPTPLPTPYNQHSQEIVKALIEANATLNTRSVFGLLYRTLTKIDGLFSELPEPSAETSQQKNPRKDFLCFLLRQGLDLDIQFSTINPMKRIPTAAHSRKISSLLLGDNAIDLSLSSGEKPSFMEELVLAHKNQPRPNLMHFIESYQNQEEQEREPIEIETEASRLGKEESSLEQEVPSLKREESSLEQEESILEEEEEPTELSSSVSPSEVNFASPISTSGALIAYAATAATQQEKKKRKDSLAIVRRSAVTKQRPTG